MPGLNTAARLLFASQYGVATRPQLLSCGYSENQVEAMVRAGRVEVVHCGTYRVPGSARPPEQRGMAAVLRCRPTAHLTGSFVLGLFGVEGFTRDCRFDVLVPPDRRVQNVSFTVRRDAAVDRDRALFERLPITTPTRALLESARYVTEHRLLAAVDSARWLGLTTLERLRTCAAGLPDRHAGARRIRRLLSSELLDVESHGERTLQRLLAGIEPQPEWQAWVTPRIRVDALWRDRSLALEYQGRRHHTGAADRHKDAQRDDELRRLGLTVVYLTTEDMRHARATRERLMHIRATLIPSDGPA